MGYRTGRELCRDICLLSRQPAKPPAGLLPAGACAGVYGGGHRPAHRSVRSVHVLVYAASCEKQYDDGGICGHILRAVGLYQRLLLEYHVAGLHRAVPADLSGGREADKGQTRAAVRDLAGCVHMDELLYIHDGMRVYGDIFCHDADHGETRLAEGCRGGSAQIRLLLAAGWRTRRCRDTPGSDDAEIDRRCDDDISADRAALLLMHRHDRPAYALREE